MLPVAKALLASKLDSVMKLGAHLQMKATFQALAKDGGGRLDKAHAVQLLQQSTTGSADGSSGSEAAELLWAEMGLAKDAFITEVMSQLCACADPN